MMGQFTISIILYFLIPYVYFKTRNNTIPRLFTFENLEKIYKQMRNAIVLSKS